MHKTPWVDIPALPDRLAAKIRHFLMGLDRSFECEIHATGLRFRYDARCLGVKIIPELAEGRFPPFLLRLRVSRGRPSNPVHFRPK